MRTPPSNEPVLTYAPGTPERATLRAELARQAGGGEVIPLIVDGRPLETSVRRPVRAPHRHDLCLGEYCEAGPDEVRRAIEAAERARPAWAALPQSARSRVFLRAAELLSGPWRQILNAATVLNQSKTAHQAEIDAACELADFFRFNVWFAEQLLADQPLSPPGVRNRMEARPLDGFVAAITPFNFTAIAGNLPTAPALLGNTVVWKPSPLAALSAHRVHELLRAAGLPPGVVEVVQGPPEMVSSVLLDDPRFAGLHFTGSTAVFRHLWSEVGRRIGRYRCFPRLVGETGGKDFVFVHESADLEALVVALVRGAFEYQGQKCSAASRVYLPRRMAREVQERLVAMVEALPMGDPADFGTFVGAVIDERAFLRLSAAQQRARADSLCRVLVGGTADRSEGWFVAPTVVQVDDPRHPLMREELFGPLLTLYVYDEERTEEALALCDDPEHGLTGAVFAADPEAQERLLSRLRFAAGNLYLNDKPTGAVVGQQPFGGSRLSGTNDKAGSAWNLARWVSPQVVKETLVPPRDWRYPYLSSDE